MGRTIATDNLNVGARTGLSAGLPHEIEKARVHVCRFVAAPVTQDVVDLLQPGLIVTAVALIDDLRLFVRMQMVKPEAACLSKSRHAGEARPHNQGGDGQTDQDPL